MASRAVTVDLVGDIIVNRPDPESAFDRMIPLFEESDILVGNLEGPLCSEGNVDVLSPLPVRMEPRMADALTRAGFDVLSLANNHTMDQGPDGLKETIDILDTAGIRHVGAGSTLAEAQAPVVVGVDGVDVGFIGIEATPYSVKLTTVPYDDNPGIYKVTVDATLPEPHIDAADLATVRQSVADAAARVDYLVPVVHFGIADTETIPVSQRALAHTLVDAGVDAVVGGQAYHPQGIEIYEDTPIFHSPGHIVFDQFSEVDILNHAHGRDALVIRLVLGDDGVRSEVIPVHIGADDQPVPLVAGQSRFQPLLDRVLDMSTVTGDDYEVTDSALQIH